jgi:hypothetical protein
MARSKSAAKKSAAKKAGKTRKSRPAPKKAAKTRKPPGAAKKAAAPRKGRTAAKKAVVTRTPARAKTAANTTTLMPEASPAIVDIDNRIAIVRNNLRDLVEQATSYSGAAAEELTSQRIAEQEAKLELLRKQREALSGYRS